MSDASDNSQTEMLTPKSSPMVTPKQPAITQEMQSLENKEDISNSNTEKKVSQGLSTIVILLVFMTISKCKTSSLNSIHEMWFAGNQAAVYTRLRSTYVHLC